MVLKDKVFESWTGNGKFDKNISSLKPSDNALHIDLQEKNNYEWWYFDARLDNGYTVIFFFHARNHLTKRTEIEITIYKPTGEKIHEFFPYDPIEFKASRKIPDIRLGNNYLDVDYTAGDYPVYNIYIEEGNICLNLKFTGLIFGWQPGEGHIKFSRNGFFA